MPLIFLLPSSTRPMRRESIDDLIQELKHLRLREAEVIERLEQANQQDQANTNVPLGIAGHTRSEAAIGAFAVGDRVFITNKIRKPAAYPSKFWTAEKERKAVVTDVDGDKIYIRTDNDVETWRLSKNLRKKNEIGRI